MSGKKIAFFDFDGTITTKDTLAENVRFLKGRVPVYIGFLLLFPWIIAYKLGLYPNDLAKQKVLRYFLSGMEQSIFQAKADEFAETKLPALIRPKALEEIERLKKEGFEIVIVSGSAESWVSLWTAKLGLHLIATRLEVINGKMTGNIEGENCYGQQKVVCIRKEFDLGKYDEVYAYGDTSGDKPMLALATKSFYKPFRTI